MKIKNFDELKEQIIVDALHDRIFKNKLMQCPKEAILEKYNYNLPDGINLQVHEECPQYSHFVLPSEVTNNTPFL